MPLAGERFASDSIRRTSDSTNRDYAEFMKRWSPELNRELTEAEYQARLRQPNAGAENARPAEPKGSTEDDGFRIAGTIYKTKAQADAEERAARAAQAKRDRIAAYEAHQEFIIATMKSCGLTDEEQGALTEELMQRGLENNLDSVIFACQRIATLKAGGQS